MGVFSSTGAATNNLISGLGNYEGMMGAKNYLNKGQNAYNQYTQQGINQLQSGANTANTAYDPYSTAGTSAIGTLQDKLANQSSTNPTLSNTSSSGVSAYLNPSSDYTTAQSNKAMESSAIASGGEGGGLAKALSNNASKLAMTNYNNAYQQMLDTNNQNFVQQQQLFNNNQQNISNYQNLANTGLTATNANQQLQQQYNSGINQDYENMGTTGYNTNASKALNYNSGVNNMFGNLGQSASNSGSALDSYFGGSGISSLFSF